MSAIDMDGMNFRKFYTLCRMKDNRERRNTSLKSQIDINHLPVTYINGSNLNKYYTFVG